MIVLHRSRDELRTLLPMLPRRTQVVVVDNGPDDGGSTLAATHGAAVIERRDNPGFGAACNLALEHVTEDVTVLLNPDTEPVDNALGKLVQRARPGGLHAPRLVNRDGSLQRSAHALPGTLGAFIPALLPIAPLRAEPFRAKRPRTVGWAVAACLAARTDLLRTLGPFDPSIHLWAEDMDLCLRARAQGIRTVLHPDLRVCHTGRHSVETEPFEQLARNRRTVVQRTRGTTARRLDDAAQLVTFATRALVKRPNERERAQLDALLKAFGPGIARAESG